MRKWAEELLWVVGDSTGVRAGTEPGTFRRHLIDAALAADAENLDRIASAFPELSHVITLWRLSGPAVLEQLADGRV